MLYALAKFMSIRVRNAIGGSGDELIVGEPHTQRLAQFSARARELAYKLMDLSCNGNEMVRLFFFLHRNRSTRKGLCQVSKFSLQIKIVFLPSGIGGQGNRKLLQKWFDQYS